MLEFDSGLENEALDVVGTAHVSMSQGAEVLSRGHAWWIGGQVLSFFFFSFLKLFICLFIY